MNAAATLARLGTMPGMRNSRLAPLAAPHAAHPPAPRWCRAVGLLLALVSPPIVWAQLATPGEAVGSRVQQVKLYPGSATVQRGFWGWIIGTR